MLSYIRHWVGYCWRLFPPFSLFFSPSPALVQDNLSPSSSVTNNYILMLHHASFIFVASLAGVSLVSGAKYVPGLDLFR